jgi:hypothetical protein
MRALLVLLAGLAMLAAFAGPTAASAPRVVLAEDFTATW